MVEGGLSLVRQLRQFGCSAALPLLVDWVMAWHPQSTLQRRWDARRLLRSESFQEAFGLGIAAGASIGGVIAIARLATVSITGWNA
jgi:hypothetical protein